MSLQVDEPSRAPARPSEMSAGSTLGGYLRPVVVASLGESVASAARRLRDARVGCVVVTRADRPIGILTDRDLALRVVAEARDPSVTRVEEIVTCDPLTLRDSDTLDTAARCMKEHGVRRLPIVDPEGIVCGIVTADDLIVELGRQLAALADAIAESADTDDSR